MVWKENKVKFPESVLCKRFFKHSLNTALLYGCSAVIPPRRKSISCKEELSG